MFSSNLNSIRISLSLSLNEFSAPKHFQKLPKNGGSICIEGEGGGSAQFY